MSEQTAKTPYEVMASTIKKDFIPTDDEIKTMNSFIMCRWLSNHPVGVELANYINTNFTMDITIQYWLVRSYMKGIKYIAYPKKDNDKNENIELICNHYNCNVSIAKSYLKLLTKEHLDEIKKLYAGGRIP